MNGNEIMESEEFKQCVDFHGHICPGLAIGFRAVKACMGELEATRAEDEELVAVVETDACSADAVQVLTGCTFGKGNFIYKDYGKMALTLFSRSNGKGVRVCQLPPSGSSNDEHRALMDKVREGSATEEERDRFRDLHRKRCLEILEKPEEELFSITPTQTVMPEKARVEPSGLCDRCGEPAMGSKLAAVEGQKICRGCLETS